MQLLPLLVVVAIGGVAAYTTIDDASYSASLLSTGAFRALVDVRTPEEWGVGHLPNATFIPSLHETGDVSRLLGCEDCPIAVYCRSGRRSKLAADVLEGAGFTNVYDVLGVQQWVDAGVDLVVDDGLDPTCCEATCFADATPSEEPATSGGVGAGVTVASLLFAVGGTTVLVAAAELVSW